MSSLELRQSSHPANNGLLFRSSSKIEIKKLKVEESEFLYRKHLMSFSEFFPHDIKQILRNKLSLGTWVAYYPLRKSDVDDKLFGVNGTVPGSWAMLSVWNSGGIFKLRIGKVPLSCFVSANVSRWVLQCLKWSAVPDFLSPFGFYFMYGVHREGPSSGKLVRALWEFMHSLAMEEEECKVIVTEVGGCDSVRLHIPHWKLLSCPEDLWCIKPLKFHDDTKTLHELTKYILSRQVFL